MAEGPSDYSRKRGFIYIASGERFVREAVDSLVQLRKFHAEPAVLICDQHLSMPHDFAEVRVELNGFDYADKIRMVESPFEKTIFLDTDILVVQSLLPIFRLLDRFDLALQPTEGGNHYELEGVPWLFFEPSAGILGWNKNSHTSEFFDRWKTDYQKIESEMGIKGAWDQRSLRSSVFYADVKSIFLPIEAQFYTYKPNFLRHSPLLFHGRNINPQIIAAASSQIHGEWSGVVLPRIGAVPDYNHCSLLQAFNFLLKFAVSVFRRRLRILLDRVGIWRLPTCKRPA